MCVCISWAEADDETRKTLGGSYIFVGRKDPISLKTKRRLGHGAPMVRDLNSALCLCQMQFDGLLLFKRFSRGDRVLAGSAALQISKQIIYLWILFRSLACT